MLITQVKPVSLYSDQKPKTPGHDLPPIELNRFVLHIMRFLQVLGMCPVSLKLKGQTGTSCSLQRLLTTWICIQMVAFAIVHVWTVSNHTTILYSMDNLGKLNDSLKLSFTIMAHFVTFFEVLFQRRHLHHFLQIYSRLRGDWSYMSLRQEVQLYKNFLLLSIIYLVTMSTIELWYNYQQSIRAIEQPFYFNLSFLPSVTLCRLRLLQIMFFLEMLRFEVQHMVRKIQDLTQLADRYRKNGSVSNLKVLEDGIHSLMRSYEQIFDMSMVLKKCTAYSLTAIYMKSYVKMLTDLYWFSWTTNRGYRNIEYLLLLPSGLNIFQLLYTSRNCMNSARFLAHSVHRLRHSVEDSSFSARILNLSLQLKHQQIIIDVFGLLTFNCYIVKSLLASIATYILVFIQIMPQFRRTT